MKHSASPQSDPRQFLTHLFKIAVKTADPMQVVAAHLPDRPKGRLLVIGAGKASARMAEAVEAAHPVPDTAGEAATRRILDLVSGLGPDDTVIALISGGGSALLCAPADGLTLDDKILVNRALLASGAPIGEINLLRKHLSRIKGGQLAAACHPARLLTLMISDVPGDDPSQIASGPTIGEASTACDALDVIDRYNISVPPHVRDALERSTVVSPDDPRLARATTQIIAAPSQSLSAAAKAAAVCGVEVRLLGDALEGEARDLGRHQAQLALDIQSAMHPNAQPVLLLSGGECTVTRGGNGIGGPNAEFTLSAAIALNGQIRVHVLACDTDGVDGAAEVAGAYAGSETLALAHQRGIDPPNALKANDAHSFFERTGGQIITGPTLTNANDFRAVLVMPPD